MIIKMGGGGNAGIDQSNAPTITFNGYWTKWYGQVYGGTAYWEAVFFTSGTLTVAGSVSADLWGIGGGGGARGGSYVHAGNGGTTSTVVGAVLTGTMAVSIGAGGTEGASGGNTTLASLISCTGGTVNTDGNATSDATRYRFADPDKSSEAGSAGTLLGSYYPGGGGWLHFRGAVNHGAGYGGGGAKDGTSIPGHPGALVVRIAM